MPHCRTRRPGPTRVSLDLNFINRLEEALAAGDTLFRTEQRTTDGRPMVTYGLRTNFDEPQVIAGRDGPVSSIIMQMTIDGPTGQPLWIDTIAYQVDGTERLTDHVELRLVENAATPPAEILAYLEPPAN
jgi:hypothetical protein